MRIRSYYETGRKNANKKLEVSPIFIGNSKEYGYRISPTKPQNPETQGRCRPGSQIPTVKAKRITESDLQVCIQNTLLFAISQIK